MAFIVPRNPLEPARRLGVGVAPSTKVLRAEDVHAFHDAEQILADARQQAERIVAEALSAFEQERLRGYQEGKEEARLEQVEQMIGNISRTVDYFSKVEGQMVDLVMRAVRKIVDDFDNNDRVLIAVKSALSVMRNQKQVTLRVNPQQAEIVKERLNDILAAFPGVGYMDIVSDHRLKADDCIVESDIGMIEASLEGQLQALRSAFEKVLGSRT